MDVEEEMQNLLLNDKLLQEVERERALSAENEAKCGELEDENLNMKGDAELQHEIKLQRVSVSDEQLKVRQVSSLWLVDVSLYPMESMIT